MRNTCVDAMHMYQAGKKEALDVFFKNLDLDEDDVHKYTAISLKEEADVTAYKTWASTLYHDPDGIQFVRNLGIPRGVQFKIRHFFGSAHSHGE